MKKIIKAIGNFFKSIYTFFDKILITPITKGILKLTDLIKNNSHGIEKFFGKRQTLIVLSLIFAILIFFIIDRESNMFTDQYTEILYGQPVTAIYNEEAYVVEGLPEEVDVILIGKRRHVFIAKQSPAKDVSVDLTGLKPGQHTVSLKYSQPLKSLNYKLDPSSVSIIIYDKVSETRQLTVDVLHKDNLDSKLYIKDIKLDRQDVIIKGAQYKLEQVATVKALVDVDNISNPQAGEINLKDVPLVAYDTEGKIVDVEIVPGKVNATLTITSPSKQVPIKVVPTGELAFGKAIKTITTNVSSVVVYGEEDAVNNLDSIPVTIDVTNLEKDKEYTINITKPNGIRDVSTKTVIVKVTIDDVNTKEFSGIQITTENLDSKYRVQALSEADAKVDVIVKGSQSVLDNLDSSTIHAYIDLSGYTAGEYEVEVKVTGEDLKLTYTPKTKKVKIRIVAN